MSEELLTNIFFQITLIALGALGTIYFGKIIIEKGAIEERGIFGLLVGSISMLIIGLSLISKN